MGITAPLLYLSSAAVGWDGLLAQAFHEPMELAGWFTESLPDLSLVLFRGGSMRLEQRQARGVWRSQHLHHGDMIVTPGGGPGAEVRWQGLSQTPMQTLHLHVSAELIAHTSEVATGQHAQPLTLAAHPRLQDPLLQQIGYALWQELEQPTGAGKLYAQTATQMLVMQLLRCYSPGRGALQEPTRGLSQRQMQRVLDFIHAHLDQDLSLDAIAQQSGFSAYHFIRLFRRATGASPHEFVVRQRIEHAQHLLATTEMPLATIAQASGFANQSHFTRAFKQHCGITPRAYRCQR